MIADILLDLNYWHYFFLLEEFNYVSKVRVTTMVLFEPEAGVVDDIDITEILALLLEFFYVLLRP
jgi:hypothetical protein